MTEVGYGAKGRFDSKKDERIAQEGKIDVEGHRMSEFMRPEKDRKRDSNDDRFPHSEVNNHEAGETEIKMCKGRSKYIVLTERRR